MAASRTSSPGRVAMGGAPTMRAASPSVSTRSGAKVSLASRAPSAGTLPKGLAMISPSPRQASAQATTQDSARVTPGSVPAPVPVTLARSLTAPPFRSLMRAWYSSSGTST